MIINNENDIYIFFEVIKQLEPTSILDAGMFLKRVGSVSRQMMNYEISRTVKLDGIDFFPEIHFPVWEMIYDKVYDRYQVFNMQNVINYDMGVLLGSGSLKETGLLEKLLPWICKKVTFLLIDQLLKTIVLQLPNIAIREIQVEESLYYLVDCKNI